MPQIAGPGRPRGSRNKFTYLLSLMLERSGFYYADELHRTLKSDLTDIKNQEYLKVLFHILPYMAVKFSDAEIKQVDDILAKFEAGKEVLEKKRVDKAKELNQIMIVAKEKVANTGVKN